MEFAPRYLFGAYGDIMRYLVFVRHGHSDATGNLSQEGKADILQTAKKLAQLVGDQGVLILSSTAPRAAETTEVLREVFQAARRQDHGVLWKDDSHHQEPNAALHLIRERAGSAEIILLVGHHGHKYLLPNYVHQVLSANMPEIPDIEKGHAQVLDVVHKTLALL